MQPSDVDIWVLLIILFLLMMLIALGYALWRLRHRNEYLAWVRLRAVARVLPCAPTRPRFPFPSECLGKCLEGDGVCTASETRPWLIFWRQAAKCACVHPAAGHEGGGGGPGSGDPGPAPPDGGEKPAPPLAGPSP